jgi:hypothetical protein
MLVNLKSNFSWNSINTQKTNEIYILDKNFLQLIRFEAYIQVKVFNFIDNILFQFWLCWHFLAILPKDY